jgi:hypothetical protein
MEADVKDVFVEKHDAAVVVEFPIDIGPACSFRRECSECMVSAIRQMVKHEC